MSNGVYNNGINYSSSADLAGREVLGMNGSLTNYIYTGKAQPDSFTKTSQKTASSAEAKKTFQGWFFGTLAALGGACGLVYLIKSGKMKDISEAVKKSASGFWENAKTGYQDFKKNYKKYLDDAKAKRKKYFSELAENRKKAKKAKADAKAASKQAKADAKAARKQAKADARAANRQAKADARAANRQAKADARAANRQAKADAKAAKKQGKNMPEAAEVNNETFVEPSKNPVQVDQKPVTVDSKPVQVEQKPDATENNLKNGAFQSDACNETAHPQNIIKNDLNVNDTASENEAYEDVLEIVNGNTKQAPEGIATKAPNEGDFAHNDDDDYEDLIKLVNSGSKPNFTASSSVGNFPDEKINSSVSIQETSFDELADNASPLLPPRMQTSADFVSLDEIEFRGKKAYFKGTDEPLNASFKVLLKDGSTASVEYMCGELRSSLITRPNGDYTNKTYTKSFLLDKRTVDIQDCVNGETKHKKLITDSFDTKVTSKKWNNKRKNCSYGTTKTVTLVEESPASIEQNETLYVKNFIADDPKKTSFLEIFDRRDLDNQRVEKIEYKTVSGIQNGKLKYKGSQVQTLNYPGVGDDIDKNLANYKKKK